MAIKQVSSTHVSIYCENSLGKKLAYAAKLEKMTQDAYIIKILEEKVGHLVVPKPKSRAKKAKVEEVAAAEVEEVAAAAVAAQA